MRAPLRVLLREALVQLRRRRGRAGGGGDVDAELGRGAAHSVLVAEQRELGDAAPQEDLGRAQDPLVAALRQHDATPVGARALEQRRAGTSAASPRPRASPRAVEKRLAVDVCSNSASADVILRGVSALILPSTTAAASAVAYVSSSVSDDRPAARAARSAPGARRGGCRPPVSTMPARRRQASRRVGEEGREQHVGAVARRDQQRAVGEPLEQVGHRHRRHEHAERLARRAPRGSPPTSSPWQAAGISPRSAPSAACPRAPRTRARRRCLRPPRRRARRAATRFATTAASWAARAAAASSARPTPPSGSRGAVRAWPETTHSTGSPRLSATRPLKASSPAVPTPAKSVPTTSTPSHDARERVEARDDLLERAALVGAHVLVADAPTRRRRRPPARPSERAEQRVVRPPATTGRKTPSRLDAPASSWCSAERDGRLAGGRLAAEQVDPAGHARHRIWWSAPSCERVAGRVKVEPFTIEVAERDAVGPAGADPQHALAAAFARAGLGAGDRARVPARAARLLGRRVRLARAGGAAERARPVPRRDRRRAHPLRARARRRDPADPHARLAEHVRRAPAARAAPAGLRPRDPVAARLRVLGAAAADDDARHREAAGTG